MQDSLVQRHRDSWDRQGRRVEYVDPLFEERIIYLAGDIDLASATNVVSKLLILERDNPEKEIQMYISSSGGGVYPGLAIYDTMQLVRSPISTIAVGWTASMGTVLLAAGSPGRRYTLPHSTIHMHPARGGMQGSSPDVEIQYKEMRRLQDIVHQILAKHTEQTVEKIAEDFDRDFYMDAAAAVEYGIIDEVLGEKDEEQDGAEE